GPVTPILQDATDIAQNLASQAAGAALSMLGQDSQAPTSEKPKVHVVVGMFFDGTGNNTANTRERMRRQDECLTAYAANAISKQTCEAELAQLDASYLNDLSNIAKLFDLYLETKEQCNQKITHIFPQYISGISTKSGAKDSGYGMATGMGRLGVAIKVEDGCLQFANRIRQKGITQIDHLTVDAFGFSRGADAARHFVTEILKGPSGALGNALAAQGISWPQQVEIRFVGLFDTVAAILNPFENDWSPHNADNAPLDIYLPPDRVQHAVQLVARDERRHNFSLNSLRNKDGSLPPNFGEWELPGVHSDIGGGYADLVMERVLLAPVAYLKEMDFSSPERSYAYKRLETLREKIADEGWLGVHNQPP